MANTIGKHEKAAPLPEALEMHYKDEIKRLKEQLEHSTLQLQEAIDLLEAKDLRIKVLEAKAETFSKALAEMTVKAVMGGVK